MQCDHLVAVDIGPHLQHATPINLKLLPPEASVSGHPLHRTPFLRAAERLLLPKLSACAAWTVASDGQKLNANHIDRRHCATSSFKPEQESCMSCSSLDNQILASCFALP